MNKNQYLKSDQELAMSTDAEHEHWSRIADEWVAWARTPNHDVFWAYRAALLTFIGRGEGQALDGFLKSHGVMLDYTLYDLEHERQDLKRAGF